jgi:hypothetical protein
MNVKHWTLTAALLAAAAIQPALIQPAVADDDLSKRIAACTREQDDALRLACFDRAAAPPATTADKAVAAKPAAEKADPAQAFGVHGSELARSREADDPKQDNTPKRLTAKVAGIEKRARGELVFTLDNGQVWAQKEVGAYFPIDVGDPVTILAGTLGSHRLVVGSRATAVTRVR